jgi:hypothetical protein
MNLRFLRLYRGAVHINTKHIVEIIHAGTRGDTHFKIILSKTYFSGFNTPIFGFIGTDSNSYTIKENEYPKEYKEIHSFLRNNTLNSHHE